MLGMIGHRCEIQRGLADVQGHIDAAVEACEQFPGATASTKESTALPSIEWDGHCQRVPAGAAEYLRGAAVLVGVKRDVPGHQEVARHLEASRRYRLESQIPDAQSRRGEKGSDRECREPMPVLAPFWIEHAFMKTHADNHPPPEFEDARASKYAFKKYPPKDVGL